MLNPHMPLASWHASLISMMTGFSVVNTVPKGYLTLCGDVCVQALQATVGAIRNARAEYNVELGRRIAARVTVAQADLRAALAAELDVLCSLAKLDRAQARRTACSLPLLPAVETNESLESKLDL